ncbi:MAG: orotate phosphoribosyltransferase [Deltaproteobacteria bacterium]|nr:orotate phosphoribosyltransferase [Deltaproteobacteria bacterium]
MEDRDRLLDLVARVAFERRDVVLSSGKRSDYYMDCRRVTLLPEGALLCGRVMYDLYRRQMSPVKAVGGPTLGADPLVTAFMLKAMEADEILPGFLVRKKTKGHGMANRIEGLYGVSEGAEVLLLEDVLTTGGSLLEALLAVREHGLNPVGAMVLVDRNEGGADACSKEGLPLFSVFKASEVAAAHDRLKQD